MQTAARDAQHGGTEKAHGAAGKGTTCITRADRGRGGVSLGISRRRGGEGGRNFIIPINCGTVNTQTCTEMAEVTITQA